MQKSGFRLSSIPTMSNAADMVQTCYRNLAVQKDGSKGKHWGRGLHKPHNRRAFSQRLTEFCNSHLIRRQRDETLFQVAATTRTAATEPVMMLPVSEAEHNESAAKVVAQLCDWLPRGIVRSSKGLRLFDDLSTYPGMK